MVQRGGKTVVGTITGCSRRRRRRRWGGVRLPAFRFARCLVCCVSLSYWTLMGITGISLRSPRLFSLSASAGGLFLPVASAFATDFSLSTLGGLSFSTPGQLGPCSASCTPLAHFLYRLALSPSYFPSSSTAYPESARHLKM